MHEQSPDDLAILGERPEDLDGYSIADLADYLDAGRQPYDDAIESSPACRHALAALARLQTVAGDLLDDEDAPDADDDAWVAQVMQHIALDAHAGADFPLAGADPDVQLVMTEGALRALVRAVGDDTPGFLIGRVRFDSDLSRLDQPLMLSAHVTVRHGIRIPPAVEQLREQIAAAVVEHTDFPQATIHIAVQDIDLPSSPLTPDAA